MTQLEQFLKEERGRLVKERGRLEEMIAKKTQRLQEVVDRLVHINGLLETDTDDNSGDLASPNISVSQGQIITDIAAEILGEREGAPMYYKDLATEVQRRGGKIAGSNPEASLVARLVSDERFVRPFRKGYYALRRDHPNAPNVGARKGGGN